MFSGGHAALPFLGWSEVQQEFVGRDQVLSGYGLAQAVSVPIFSFAVFHAYLLTGSVDQLWDASFSHLFQFYGRNEE